MNMMAFSVAGSILIVSVLLLFRFNNVYFLATAIYCLGLIVGLIL